MQMQFSCSNSPILLLSFYSVIRKIISISELLKMKLVLCFLALMENADGHGDCLRPTKDDISSNSEKVKKQKLENGLLNYAPSSKSNISSTSAPNSLKPLVNGDVKAAVTSIQAVSRSTPTTPAGSVQAVA